MIKEWLRAVEGADFADWLNVAAYLSAAAACMGAGRTAWIIRQQRDRVFWLLAAGALLFLGVNELLDLQALLTAVGRAHAKANGWYGQHRQVQYVFLVGLTAVSVLIAIGVLILTRRARASVRVALIGLGFIGLFVLYRAASFHHLDELLGRKTFGFVWGDTQELIGIIVVGLAAIAYASGRRRRR